MKKQLFRVFSLLRYLILLAVLYMAWKQLDRILSLINEYEIISFSFPFLVTAVLLMPVNLCGEIIKWQILSSSYRNNKGFIRGAREVISGISLAIVSPVRLGDYIGKVAHYKPEQQLNIIAMNAVGNIAQLLAVLIGSLVALLLAPNHLWSLIDITEHRLAIICSYSLMLVLSLSFFFFIKKGYQFVVRKVTNAKIRLLLYKMSGLELIRAAQLSKVLGIACLRFIIFSSQFVLLMYFFGSTLSTIDAYICVALTYLIQSGVPLPAFFSLIIRSEAIVMLTESMGTYAYPALMASYAMWLLNWGIPALLGLISLWYINLKKTLGHASSSSNPGL